MAQSSSRAVPTGVYAVAALSIATGLLVHLFAIPAGGPFQQLETMRSLSGAQLRYRFFSPVTPLLIPAKDALAARLVDPLTRAAFGPPQGKKILLTGAALNDYLTAKSLHVPAPLAHAWDEAVTFGLAIVIFFRDFLSSKLGQGLFFGILGHGLPLSLFAVVEPLKGGRTRNAFTGVLFSVLVMLIGQLICIGAALPLLFVPYYAWQRVSEVRPAARHLSEHSMLTALSRRAGSTRTFSRSRRRRRRRSFS